MSQISPMPEQLLNALRELIQKGRKRAMRAVDMVHRCKPSPSPSRIGTHCVPI